MDIELKRTGSCRDCHYYASDAGECHAAPPRACGWPDVQTDGWCGEYEPHTSRSTDAMIVSRQWVMDVTAAIERLDALLSDD